MGIPRQYRKTFLTLQDAISASRYAVERRTVNLFRHRTCADLPCLRGTRLWLGIVSWFPLRATPPRASSQARRLLCQDGGPSGATA